MPLTQAPAPSFQSAIVLTLPLRRTITYGSKLCKIKHLCGFPFPTSYVKIFNLVQQNSMSSEKTLLLPLYLPIPQRANHTMSHTSIETLHNNILWMNPLQNASQRTWIFRHASVSGTYPCQSVSPLVRWSYF